MHRGGEVAVGDRLGERVPDGVGRRLGDPQVDGQRDAVREHGGQHAVGDPQPVPFDQPLDGEGDRDEQHGDAGRQPGEADAAAAGACSVPLSMSCSRPAVVPCAKVAMASTMAMPSSPSTEPQQVGGAVHAGGEQRLVALDALGGLRVAVPGAVARRQCRSRFSPAVGGVTRRSRAGLPSPGLPRRSGRPRPRFLRRRVRVRPTGRCSSRPPVPVRGAGSAVRRGPVLFVTCGRPKRRRHGSGARGAARRRGQHRARRLRPLEDSPCRRRPLPFRPDPVSLVTARTMVARGCGTRASGGSSGSGPLRPPGRRTAGRAAVGGVRHHCPHAWE